MSFRLLERFYHLVDDLRPGQDIPLCRAELATLVTGPFGRLRTCESKVFALCIHYGELAAMFRPFLTLGIGLRFPNGLDDLFRLHPFAQQVARLLAVADVRKHLLGLNSHVRLPPQNAVAARKLSRLLRAAHLSGSR